MINRDTALGMFGFAFLLGWIVFMTKDDSDFNLFIMLGQAIAVGCGVAIALGSVDLNEI